MKKNIIMIPYADISSMRGGVNLLDENRLEIYMKNCCVALLSAKRHNPDTDVALVTNVNVLEKHKELFSKNGILIINVEFSTFRFPDDYKWGLAFYKLCALWHVVNQYEYQYYAYLDSDVYVQSEFENIWAECQHNILLYDINHGLQVKNYSLFLQDIKAFSGHEAVTHYGGEFFAASRDDARMFIKEASMIFDKMIQEGFHTNFGDEFILSLVAHRHRDKIRNAGAYIFRFWTRDFRLVSTAYQFDPVTVLHVPNEKKSGMIKIYDYYNKHGELPPNKKVYRLLNISRKCKKNVIRGWLKAVLKR